MLIKRVFKLPLSCKEILRLVEAWRLIFGNGPTVTIDGQVYSDDGLLAYPHGSEVISYGRKYVTVRLDGQPVRLDPSHCGSGTDSFIVLEEDVREP